MNIDNIRDMLCDYMDDESVRKILNAVKELVENEANIVRRDFCDLYDHVADHCYDILDNTSYQEKYADYADMWMNRNAR